MWDDRKQALSAKPRVTTLLGQWGPELLVLLVAVALRVEGLHQVSLCHYDEGVYVSSAMRLASRAPEGFAFGQAQHAPPLYPILVSMLYRMTGIPWPNFSLYVNVLFGTFTVALVYELARRIWSRPIGVVAALLLAASDYHIALSRMALTDVSFTFWFTASLVAFLHADRCWQRGARWSSWGWLVVAGLCGGGAWNTKYHGWLAPVFMALFAVAAAARSFIQKGNDQGATKQQLTSTATRDDIANLPFRLSLASIVLAIAALSFLPWFLYIERHLPGGYRSVLHVHKSYVGSVTDWPAHAWVLLQALPAFRHYGWLLLVNLGIVGLAVSGGDWPRRLVLLLLVGFAACLGTDEVLLAVGALSAVRFLWVHGTGRQSEVSGPPSKRLAAGLFWGQGAESLLVSVWLLGWCVLTPFYEPFVRLLLPVWPAVAVLAAPQLWQLIADGSRRLGQIATSVDSAERYNLAGCFSLAELASLVVFLGWLCLTQPFGFLPGPDLWQRWDSRRGYQEFARWVAQNTPQDAAFLCQGQPPFSIYCPRQAIVLGNEPFSAATRGLAPHRSAYLALDFRAIHEAEPTARNDIAKNAAALELIHAIPLDCNVVVLLDYLSPVKVAEKIAHNEAVLQKLASSENTLLPIPAPIESASLDAIAVYRIRLDKLADRP